MPNRWKCLLAGPPEAGKSTLCAALLEPGSERRVIKTQSPVFHKDLMVDLPVPSGLRGTGRGFRSGSGPPREKGSASFGREPR